MNTICYIVTSFWAYGELTIALDFALRTREAGYEPIFLIPPSHENIVKKHNIKYVTLIPKARKLNLILFNEIETKYRPAAVVLSDFLNYKFCERHYGLTIDDLAIFSGKIGGFDIYDFESTDGRVDTYGFLAENMYNLSFKCCDFLLQPCPVNHLQKADQREFRYSLFGQITPRTEAEKEAARASLGLKDNQKIILITSAVWQQRYRLYKDIIPFIKTCNRVLEMVFDMLPPEVTIISIGSQTLYPNQKKSNFRHYDQMMPDEFQRINQATDLYISNNYISTSMIKIALSGVPTLLIQNSIYKRNGSEKWLKYENRKIPKILDQCPVAYPFRLFPVGWYSFLKKVVKDNPFYSLMDHAELFTPKTVKDKIIKSLAEGDIFADKRYAYLDSLKTLPTVEKDFKL